MARPASDIRERVIVSARTRFLHEGVDGASLRRIADDAGTNIGMVYYYFRTKDELLLAVIEDVYLELLADIEHIFGTAQPFERKVEAFYARVASLCDRELDVLRLILREALVSSERLTQLAGRFARGHVPIVLAALSQAISQGELDAKQHPAVLLAATFLLGFMPQLMHRRVSAAGLEIARLLPPREQVADAMSHVLLHGIDAGGESPAKRAQHAAAPRTRSPAQAMSGARRARTGKQSRRHERS